MKLINKNFADIEKGIDEEKKTITHFITVEEIDRAGDIVRVKGMDDAAFNENPQVLYGHGKTTFPIGRSIWRKVATRDGKKGILAGTQFNDTPEAQTVFTLWKDGFLNATSIGFMAKQGGVEAIKDEDGWVTGYDFKSWELLEYSIVPIPANRSALRKALDTIECKSVRDSIEEELHEEELNDLPARIQDIEKTSLDLIEKINERMTALEESLPRLTASHEEVEILRGIVEVLNTELNQLKQPAENLVKISGDELKKVVTGIIDGKFSRIKTKL